MAPSRHVLTIGALLIAVAFIAGGYFLSMKREAPKAGALSTAGALKEYAEKDTDADGLPDWKETVYGTDPSNPHSLSPTLTDKEAVNQGLAKPGDTVVSAGTAVSSPSVSYTDEDFGIQAPAKGSFSETFSKEVLETYIKEGGANSLDQQTQDMVIAKLMESFTSEAGELIESSYTAASVKTSPTMTVNQYILALDTAFTASGLGNEDVGKLMLLAQDLVEKQNEKARSELVRLGAVFKAAALNVSRVEVPSALSREHLILLQSFENLGFIGERTAKYEQDPFAVLAAFAAYRPAAGGIVRSYVTIGNSVLSEGQPAAGSLAAMLVEFARKHANDKI